MSHILIVLIVVIIIIAVLGTIGYFSIPRDVREYDQAREKEDRDWRAQMRKEYFEEKRKQQAIEERNRNEFSCHICHRRSAGGVGTGDNGTGTPTATAWDASRNIQTCRNCHEYMCLETCTHNPPHTSMGNEDVYSLYSGTLLCKWCFNRGVR